MFLRGVVAASMALLIGVPGTAQRGPTRYYRYQSIGVFAGGTAYAGDLSYSNSLGFPSRQIASLRTMSFATGLQYHWHFHPHASLRLSGTIGAFEAWDQDASDVTRKVRNLHVQTYLFDGAAQLIYEWFTNDREYRWRPPVSPYIGLGIGIVNWAPTSFVDVGRRTNRTLLRPLRTEGQESPYAQVAVVLPITAGVRFKLADRWDLRTEVSLRYALTDYLDDVSGAGNDIGGFARVYDSPESQFFGDRRLDRSGSNRRGDPNTNDWYAFVGVSLSYILYANDPCPYPYRRHRKQGLRF